MMSNERLENDGEYERAAALAVFHLDIRRAISILTKGSNDPSQEKSHLRLIAMALAGSSDMVTKGGLWRDTCLDPSLLSEVTHPYLRACFAFLGNETKDFEPVLQRSDLDFFDRVAFACRYLEDAEVSLTATLTQVVNLYRSFD